MLYLYGSETGTAEDVAYKLMNTQPHSRISSLSSFDVLSLPQERLVVFVVSTTGDGEVPSSMQGFWQFLLRKSLAADSLKSLSFAVFGLGDSSYDKFNAAARKLSRRLRQLGAGEIIPVGLGDDQAQYGFLSALNPWIEKLVEALHLNAENEDKTQGPKMPPVEYEIDWLSGSVFISQTKLPFERPQQCKMAAGSPPISAVVKSNKRMTAPGWGQDVRHIVLDLGSSLVEVAAGDVATIHPHNPPDAVARALSLVLPLLPPSITKDSVLAVRWLCSERDPGRKNRLRDAQCSLEELFARLLDVAGVPRRAFFLGLAAFASDPDERDKLVELASAEGTDLYYEYCIREHRSYVEVLEEFPSARPPLEHLLALLPPLQPRHYSIASSGRCYPSEVHLCCAVVERTTPYGRRRRGVCSSYLAALQPDPDPQGQRVSMWVRSGAFSCPPVASVPIICVGPGTGVAPMRAMLQERAALARGAAAQQPSLLFFGCRKRQADFLFCEEWTTLGEARGLLADANVGDTDAYCNSAGTVSVTTAFSRDGPEDVAKTYVQSKLVLHGTLVWRLLEAGAVVLVSGSARRMPADVRKALCRVVRERGGLAETEAEAYIAALESRGRYKVEAWS